MRWWFGGLWRHREFRSLWAGQTVSVFGTQVTALALPLTAILALEATPFQMGLLGAFQYAPFLVVGLPAGVWVDRLRRRPLMIGADLGRALLLGSIPAAAAIDRLSMAQLYLVAFLTGVLTVFFDVAYQSILPSLVRREDLVEGNSKLEISRSTAEIAGPGLAGGLVQLVTAPIALVVDSLSYLASALLLGLIRAPEPPPARDRRASLWGEIGDGLRMVVRHPLLRAIAGCTATVNLFGNMFQAVFVLYLTGVLGIEPLFIGLILGASGVSGLLGAVLAGPVARRWGPGPTITGAMMIGGLGRFLVPVASGSPMVVVVTLAAAQFLLGLFGPIYNVNQVSLRQTITPDRMQGRMNASMRFLVWGTLPIGALLGGFLGEAIGLWWTLVVAAVGGQLGFLWLALSPMPRLRAHPRDAMPSD